MRADFVHITAISSACWLMLLAPVPAASAADHPRGKLELASKVSRPSLGSVTSVTISADGNYLYAAAWDPGAVNVFQRDQATGELTHLQELSDETHLNGAVALRLSPSNDYAAVTSFRAKSLSLYRRSDDGTLSFLDVVTEGDMMDPNDPDQLVYGISWAIDSTFSIDSKFIHVSNASGSDGMTTFRIDDDSLVFVEHNVGIDGCFDNTRGTVAHPGGASILITSSTANSLVATEMDKNSGQLDLRDVIVDDNDSVPYLEGAMAVALSPEGDHVYVSSGRFRGDNAVTVFDFDTDSMRLDLVQSLSADEGDFHDFVGGNEIICSPDGRNVYAAATRSGSVAMFEREPDDGHLTYIDSVVDSQATAGAAGICVSPDGRFVYIAAEDSATVSVFRRDVEPSIDSPSAENDPTEDSVDESVQRDE